MRTILAITVVALGSLPALADLHGGMRAFRAERYEEALEAFREPPVSAEGRFYAGAALYKLGRHEEAIEALEEAFALDGSLAGEVGTLYLGLARYELKLYRSAATAFRRLLALDAGSRLATLAREHLAEIQRLPPARIEALAWYLDRGLSRAADRRHRLVLAYLGELHHLSPDYRKETVGLHRAAALNALGRAQEALEALGELKGAGVDVQRGRALIALGRRDDGRVALERAAGSGDPHWAEPASAFLEAVR